VSGEAVSLRRDELFASADRELLPETIDLLVDRASGAAEIDVLIPAHGTPELTNAAIGSLLRHERDATIHVLVVEGSGRREDFDAIVRDERVTRVLRLTDAEVAERMHGHGSYRMALSCAVGVRLSTAPHVFVSHSDMVTTETNAVSFLRSKLAGGARVAAYTQRGLVPLTGGVLFDRTLLEEPGLDWLPIPENPFAPGTPLESVLPLVYTNVGVDCGEQFLYSELARGRPVYVCASRGGSSDWWKDPLGYYDVPAEEIRAAVARAGVPLRYAPLPTTREEFERRYRHVIDASNARWWVREPRKYWRYCFDDEGNLALVHHGRGTLKGDTRRWLRFAAGYA
jgi:hypothetical protein